jgi:hypothetical protein
MKKVFYYSLVLVTGLLFSACATIINGSKQYVTVNSTPVGAHVTVDGQDIGVTPTGTKLDRKDRHVVKIEMDGYHPQETVMYPKVSGWVAGNILFGGFIGLAIDAITGSMYRLTPEQVNSRLNISGTGSIKMKDGIYVDVVMEPEAGWEKIGQLEKK